MRVYFHKNFLTEDCVDWVHGNLIFCSITDQTFGVCESNIAGCGAVTLVVGNDFNLKEQSKRINNKAVKKNMKNFNEVALVTFV